MQRVSRFFLILAVLFAMLVPPSIAWHQAAAIGDPGVAAVDQFPNLPPLSELARLPSADIAAHWSRIQRTVLDDAQAKSANPALPRQLQSKYEDIVFETSKRMSWVNSIIGAHDSNLSERLRRSCIEHLQGYEAYWTGRWPPPVPVGLMPEEKP
jgi:hypothetical protein